ncbi:hypothetical protein NBH00_12920 [Paraconexibacter antarcticus]|uniref:Uncharacterized protein n=1 Tax=Paraconexibacter antarcticus TaxID=2949664 RepID=A0ABY5DKM2_9ACTN|nr:hypothetical protein [Paraconexibacter antarcticus]UTI62268.1 hypothetical protein NBH00_12920 [Paraconexibacter antarcticus]
MKTPASTRRAGRSTITAGALVATVLLLSVAASPALGGPSLSSLKTSVTKALKLAKTADARSRKALKLAARPGPRGPSGPPGPAGPAGGTGAGGSAAATVLDFRADPGTTNQVIYDHGGLVLTASCTTGPTILVTAKTRVDHAILHAANIIGGTPPATTTELVQKNDFLISGTQTIASTGHLQGTATFSTPTGGVTTLAYGAEQGAFGAGSAKGCWFGGTANSG